MHPAGVAGIFGALVVVRVSPGAGRAVELVRGMRFSPPVGRQPAVEAVREMLPPEERT